MTTKHIGALIPVRLKSERLPGKALMDICGRPVIHHLLDRVTACKHIRDPKDAVVCTTHDPSDDALEECVERYGASVFRGSTDDIIRRFGDAMDAFGFDAVVQADGDDPLSATEYMDATMDRLIASDELDIVTVTGLPLGCATKSFSRAAMNKVLNSYRTEQNDTGFIYFFTKSGVCRHLDITANDPMHADDRARLTLDYPVDLELFRRIFEGLYVPGEVFGLSEAVEFLRKNPSLREINSSVEEEYWERTEGKAFLEYADPDSTTIKRISV